MGKEEAFDSFYVSTRQQLLHEAFALTGDLPASARAVREAYVAAWHHWRKVSRAENRLTWVRSRAWMNAQRWHTARIWHRNKGVSAQQRAVLDALTRLPGPQRRALLLIHCAGVDLPEAARFLGLTQPMAEQALQSATANLAARLEIGSALV
ncbi:MAG: sigma factor-like helix-turn-helix DNA-binding protein, partial [Nocardioidaceae bacterium]